MICPLCFSYLSEDFEPLYLFKCYSCHKFKLYVTKGNIDKAIFLTSNYKLSIFFNLKIMIADNLLTKEYFIIKTIFIDTSFDIGSQIENILLLS